MQRILQFLIDFLSKFIKSVDAVDENISPMLISFTEHVKFLPPYSVTWERGDAAYISIIDTGISVTRINNNWVLKQKVKEGFEYSKNFPCNDANDELIHRTMDRLGEIINNHIVEAMTAGGTK